MAELMTISGMVLSSMPMGEYDRRIVLLTPDRGKISGFARGARRPGNLMMAASQPFVYADFSAFEGKSSYTFTGAKVVEYFDSLREDITLMTYGSYFLELAGYFTRENEDCRDTLALLYLAVKALVRRKIPVELIRELFELRMLTIHGEYPDFFTCCECGRRENLAAFSLAGKGMLCAEHAGSERRLREGDRGECPSFEVKGRVFLSPAAVYAAQMAVTAPLGRLFAFTISREAVAQLHEVLDLFMGQVIDRKMKSLELLSVLQQE